MPCPCHASALVANTACSAIPDACEELLRKVVSFISSSPKRACIFDQFQKSFSFDKTCRKILKLSETQWLLRHACVAERKLGCPVKIFARRAIEQEIKVWGCFTISDAKFRNTSIPLAS